MANKTSSEVHIVYDIWNLILSLSVSLVPIFLNVIENKMTDARVRKVVIPTNKLK